MRRVEEEFRCLEIDKLEYYMNFILPILLMCGSILAFFIVNGLLILARLWHVIENRNKLPLINKIFTIPTLIIWIVYHSIFVILYVG